MINKFELRISRFVNENSLRALFFVSYISTTKYTPFCFVCCVRSILAMRPFTSWATQPPLSLCMGRTVTKNVHPIADDHHPQTVLRMRCRPPKNIINQWKRDHIIKNTVYAELSSRSMMLWIHQTSREENLSTRSIIFVFVFVELVQIFSSSSSSFVVCTIILILRGRVLLVVVTAITTLKFHIKK